MKLESDIKTVFIRPVNNYISKYSNGKKVSAAQYIVELICENKAKINKEDLHYRFWISKKWSTFYKNQIATAHKLVKQYDPIAIIRALKDPRSIKTYSLRSPFLMAIIKEYAKNILEQNKSITIDTERKENIKFTRKNKSQKDILSKLEELDNGESERGS